MGEVIDFERYRPKTGERARNGLVMELMPPVILVGYYENGVLLEQQQLLSEDMIRDLLDQMG